MINVSVQEDNYELLILTETLPPHFTPRRKHYSLKTI